MDERDGRHKAQRMGLSVAGVIGVLIEAKSKGLVESVRSHLDELRGIAGFYVSKALYERVIEIAGESRE